MPIVTIWERYNENSARWEHNHITNGYSPKDTEPKPSNTLQKKSWATAKWRSSAATIDENYVVTAD